MKKMEERSVKEGTDGRKGCRNDRMVGREDGKKGWGTGRNET